MILHVDLVGILWSLQDVVRGDRCGYYTGIYQVCSQAGRRREVKRSIYMQRYPRFKPEMHEGNTIRLYTLNEITEIFSGLGLCVEDSFADFSGSTSSENEIQLMVCSVKKWY